ncbi:MAG: hypothetical protein DHS80DRAFT_31433 [Piptocephalis tieghemiana]|nr:MAG: hypothetical protein DHS80DRAFT_31433 [Piptocephalis tieghemiana]
MRSSSFLLGLTSTTILLLIALVHVSHVHGSQLNRQLYVPESYDPENQASIVKELITALDGSPKDAPHAQNTLARIDEFGSSELNDVIASFSQSLWGKKLGKLCKYEWDEKEVRQTFSLPGWKRPLPPGMVSIARGLCYLVYPKNDKYSAARNFVIARRVQQRLLFHYWYLFFPKEACNTAYLLRKCILKRYPFLMSIGTPSYSSPDSESSQEKAAFDYSVTLPASVFPIIEKLSNALAKQGSGIKYKYLIHPEKIFSSSSSTDRSSLESKIEQIQNSQFQLDLSLLSSVHFLKSLMSKESIHKAGHRCIWSMNGMSGALKPLFGPSLPSKKQYSWISTPISKLLGEEESFETISQQEMTQMIQSFLMSPYIMIYWIYYLIHFPPSGSSKKHWNDILESLCGSDDKCQKEMDHAFLNFKSA